MRHAMVSISRNLLVTSVVVIVVARFQHLLMGGCGMSWQFVGGRTWVAAACSMHACNSHAEALLALVAGSQVLLKGNKAAHHKQQQ